MLIGLYVFQGVILLVVTTIAIVIATRESGDE